MRGTDDDEISLAAVQKLFNFRNPIPVTIVEQTFRHKWKIVKRFAHIGRKWFYVATAKQKINSAQAELIDRLEQTLG